MNRHPAPLVNLAALLVWGALAVSPVVAQVSAVPQTMNFQGRLSRPDGTPIANGTYNIRFSLWNVAAGGTAAANEKWNQTVASVQVRNGVFAVPLNVSTGAADKFSGNLWLEIKIGADAALTPRQPLVTVPYAFKSDLALTVPDGSITNAKIAVGTITADRFAANIFNPLTWLLGGNSATNPAAQFLGTTDAQPIALRTNNVERMRILASGRVGIGTQTPGYALEIAGTTYSKTTSGNGVYGETSVGSNAGVFGLGTATLGWGVRGLNSASNNVGYLGIANAAVYGDAVDVNSNGVWGHANSLKNAVYGANDGTGSGVYGISAGGNGVYGVNASNYNAGVWGITNAGLGFGVYGKHTVTQNFGLLGAGNTGVYGEAINAQSNGVWGHANNAFNAVYGVNEGSGNGVQGASTGGYGVYGVSTKNAGTGIFGYCETGIGVAGTSVNRRGVVGTSTYGAGVYGTSTNSDGVNGIASGAGDGVYGTSASGRGVYGASTRGAGVYGVSTNSTGVVGVTSYGGAFGVLARQLDSGYTALFSDGRAGGTESWENFSDARFKTNVVTLDNALESILKLRGVNFEWDRENWPDRHFSQGRQIGFIAQELEKVFPELVHTDHEGYKSVTYATLTPILVEAMKTQQKQLEAEHAAIKTLKAENAELKAELAEIKAAIRKLQTDRK